MTKLWACTLAFPLFSSVLHFRTVQGRWEGGEVQLTLLNSVKSDSGTQTRNTDLNSQSCSIFVFSLLCVSIPVSCSALRDSEGWLGPSSVSPAEPCAGPGEDLDDSEAVCLAASKPVSLDLLCLVFLFVL